MVILAVFVGIALLILIHEFGHFVVAKLSGILVEEFGFGFPPRIFAKKIGETVYSINLLPFGGFVKMFGEDAPPASSGQGVNLGRSFSAQPAWRRAAIIAAGVIMNFVLGWFLLSGIFMVGTPQVVMISEVFPGSPAAQAGILPQDQVKDFKTAREVVDFISGNRGREITLTLQRGAEELKITATPRLEGEAALGVGIVDAGENCDGCCRANRAFRYRDRSRRARVFVPGAADRADFLEPGSFERNAVSGAGRRPPPFHRH